MDNVMEMLIAIKSRASLHNWTLWAVTLILFTPISGLYDEYTDNTELIQQTAGYDIRLQCGLQGLVSDDKLANVKIHWFFKQCNENPATFGHSCHDFQEAAEEWTQLPCEENFCKPDLLLRNVTEKYSGLYKCTVYPYRLDDATTLDIQLVRTYQLDVKNASIGVPEFVDEYPLNKTTSVGQQVVFQCRVHSEVHPTIRWFRRIPELSAGMEYALGMEQLESAHIVRYNGHTYELLRAAREKFIGDQTYLSKLILNDVRLQDEGVYACVAISYRGHRIREAYLRVFAEDEADYWADYDADAEVPTDPKEFWLLFLMPLGLAMLPLCVWLCYTVGKRYKADACGEEAAMARPQYSDEDKATTGLGSPNDAADYDAYEYYRPGCYCTPQLVGHDDTPYTCVHTTTGCLQPGTAPWLCCNAATYVVDAYGMVYYLSDFEHHLQLPTSALALETEITYHFFEQDDAEDMEEDPGVSPRKRERFQDDDDYDDDGADADDDSGELEEIAERSLGKSDPVRLRKRENVYRDKQGYLVEEPMEPDVPIMQ